MLATLASTVAIALENARLYDQLRRAEQRKKEDLEQAREVQQLLLPREMPKLPGIDIAVFYMPAQELGGDFYQFLPYGDRCLAIAVGDVVVFCSDGISEQTNVLGEEFGVERLILRLAEERACCTAEGIAGDIVRAVKEHAGESASCREPHDDRTIVVMRVTDEIG